MSNIYITKPGIPRPILSEMSATVFADYLANLNVAVPSDGFLDFRAFEGFVFEVGFTDAVVNEPVSFNGKSSAQITATPTGSVTTDSQGRMTAQAGAKIRETGKVFLGGSMLQVTPVDPDVVLAIRPINGGAGEGFTYDVNTGAWALIANGASVLSGTAAATDKTLQFTLRITEAAFTLGNTAQPSLVTVPRTFKATIGNAALGVLQSSGAAVGNNLAFTATERFTPSALSQGNTPLTITSNAGNTTIYTLFTGEVLTNAATSVRQVVLIPNQLNTVNLADDGDIGGGFGTLNWAVASGNLPSGMSLSSVGVLSGTPTQNFNGLVTLRVSDASTGSVTIDYRIIVNASVSAEFAPPAGRVNDYYTYAPTIPGLQSASVVAGFLPPNLQITNAARIQGEATTAGIYDLVVRLVKIGSITGGVPTYVNEDIPVSIEIYQALSVSRVNEDGDEIPLMEGQIYVSDLNETFTLEPAGGSGLYQYSIDNGGSISGEGQVQFFRTGTTTIVVRDVETDVVSTYVFNVVGQENITGVAVRTQSEEVADFNPAVDILTTCEADNVQIGFAAMHLLRGLEAGNLPRKEPIHFSRVEGGIATDNGKTFAMFQSNVAGAFAVSDNAADGAPFILQFAVSGTIANSAEDFEVGIVSKVEVGTVTRSALKFAVAITTSGGVRVAELRRAGVSQVGTQTPILEGEEIGFGVFRDGVYLYKNGVVESQIVSNTFSCSGLDLVFLASGANQIIGGLITGLTYSIESVGSATEVGTINAQTGAYNPSPDNIGLIRIKAVPSGNSAAAYYASVRVIKPALFRSFTGALIEGVAVKMFIAEQARLDNLPLRLDEKGRPDRNQLKNPVWVGDLAGAVEIDTPFTRNSFRSDVSVTSSSVTIDLLTLTSGYLRVRDIEVVRRLIPFTEIGVSNGVRRLSQKTSGCRKKMRVVLIWENPDCEDVSVWDAFEIPNAESFTPMKISAGTTVQTQLPLTIEGYKDDDGYLWHYYQFDKHYQRIG